MINGDREQGGDGVDKTSARWHAGEECYEGRWKHYCGCDERG